MTSVTLQSSAACPPRPLRALVVKTVGGGWTTLTGDGVETSFQQGATESTLNQQYPRSLSLSPGKMQQD